jgi:nucleoside-diphosphate-sugar epimerase
MLKAETIFLTGFPGFIATRLVRQLAADAGRLLLLVQPPFAERALFEVKQIAVEMGRPVSDFSLLPGDITEPGFGLTPAELERVQSETTIIFHLAAIYDLAVARELALRVNVNGTRNVNDFARRVRKLRQYHYVSTCYVAGKRTGRILETELQHTAGFRNYYEETKYLAELEVQALQSELPVTIHRPSVVCGDSRTGETAKYDGIYYLIHYLLKWPSVLSSFNIGNRDVALNLVPVDFVVDAMATLAGEPLAEGKTVQLADPAPLSTRELFDKIACAIGGRHSRITIPASLVHRSLMLPLAPKISDLPHSAVPYFFLKQNYDTTQATALLKPHGIRCPPFQSYVDTVVDFATRHPVLP